MVIVAPRAFLSSLLIRDGFLQSVFHSPIFASGNDRLPPMPIPLQPAGAAPCASRLRRGRSATGKLCRLILAVAIIVTALAAFLTGTLPPLLFSVFSVLTPSSTFAATYSAHRDSIIFPLDSRNPILNSNSEVGTLILARTIKLKGIDTGNEMSDSTRAETRAKEAISNGSALPASNRQERHRKELHNGGRKVSFWALPPDQALLYAKSEIEHAPLVTDDPDLYAPVFRNLSVFKRSYELMEKILKVYIYPDGSRPIFHTPELQGIYASEGWFMKLMEESRLFAVKDPKKAHLFYLPYSSRRLRDVVYTPGSHNIKPLAIFLRDYVNSISSKYPFWNRTRGSDHFLVACHDWGPYSTKMHPELRENTIKALCNADTSERIFIRGKDVSLPETTIKVPKRPLKYIGGKRVSRRPILAFYAGLMHGRVRPTLEKLWGNDTGGDMRIFRRLPSRISRNMSYVEHMKSSRYCICPMGYEVNSPRIVEAIYYECVPVIIADNFVLPFEEVLNWSAFSVVVAEKDIADLRNILLAIPLRRYLKMQECVKRVQKHFLWHHKPEKYDLFHVILHSIWFSRLNQIQNFAEVA